LFNIFAATIHIGGYGQVAGNCECGNEPSVSLKSEEFLA
jgi:hypothetical protein